jgi:hypothetical protein
MQGRHGPPIKDIIKFRIFGLYSVFSIFFGISAVTSCHHGMAGPSKISINLEFLDWILYFLFSMVYQLLPAVTMQAGPPMKDINKFWIFGLDSVFSIFFGISAVTSCHHAGEALLYQRY